MTRRMNWNKVQSEALQRAKGTESIRPFTQSSRPQDMGSCGICGFPAAIRHGNYGAFMGCSRYPECRGTCRLVDGGASGEWRDGALHTTRERTKTQTEHSTHGEPKLQSALDNSHQSGGTQK